MAALRLEARTALPLTEISAFALRQGEAGTELIAVGDDDFGVLCVPLSDDGQLGESKRCDLWRKLPMDVVASSDGSQFEGVACDGDGHVLVLQEGPARVLVLSRRLDTLLHTIRLIVDPDEPDFGEKWHDDDNARGEGMVLLRDGHLLIAKQRKPIRLIEFGPAGDDRCTAMQDLNAGWPRHFQPYIARADGAPPIRSGRLTADGDEAEIANRCASGLRIAVDHDNAQPEPAGRERMREADNAGSHDRKIELLLCCCHVRRFVPRNGDLGRDGGRQMSENNGKTISPLQRCRAGGVRVPSLPAARSPLRPTSACRSGSLAWRERRRRAGTVPARRFPPLPP